MQQTLISANLATVKHALCASVRDRIGELGGMLDDKFKLRAM